MEINNYTPFYLTIDITIIIISLNYQEVYFYWSFYLIIGVIIIIIIIILMKHYRIIKKMDIN